MITTSRNGSQGLIVLRQWIVPRDLPPAPTWEHEEEIRAQGYRCIAGLDEVGRGAIAGPVVAAAVVLPPRIQTPWLAEVRDSKQLSRTKRESLSPLIQAAALATGIGMVPAEVVDAVGIVQATRLAMCKAIEQISPSPDFLVIDALDLPEVSLPQRSIIHGDRISLSVACASIVAKVHRDRYMMEQAVLYPAYGFARHKGYPTEQHLSGLRRSGPCPIHRYTFAPVERLAKRGSA